MHNVYIYIYTYITNIVYSVMLYLVASLCASVPQAERRGAACSNPTHSTTTIVMFLSICSVIIIVIIIYF